LLGVFPQKPLGQAEFASKLTFGRHVANGYHYWLGGLSMAGGSVEWLRGILGEPAMNYKEILRLLPEAPDKPGSLLYFPYLAGRSSPWPDPQVRGAFIGLRQSHSRADLLQAVLEGTAYQIEAIRRAAEQTTGMPIKRIIAAGGGTHNPAWLQIKADVTGCEHIVALTEATLLGAVMLAGLCCGAFVDEADALAAVTPQRSQQTTFSPRAAVHQQYQHIYNHGFLTWQEPLRDYDRC
jgi:xylulokinase